MGGKGGSVSTTRKPCVRTEKMQLIRYDAMCQAIAECERVDEVKEIRDKAIAIEAYAKQAMNTDAERQACNIRLRAERKVGQMLKDMEKAKGARQPGTHRGTTRLHDGTASTLSDMGISKQQSSRWQKLAEVNEKEFESALADPEEKPSTSGMIRKANGKQNKMDEDALWLWGRMRDFESRIFDRNIAFLIDEMTATMQSDLQRIAPQMVIFFQNLEDQINE